MRQMLRPILALLLVLILGNDAGADRRPRPAGAAQIRNVAHALFSFERVKVRGGTVRRHQATRGYYGQHELKFKSGHHIRASAMLSFLFDEGKLLVAGGRGQSKVLWRSADGGKVRTLGTLQRVGKETIFTPTTRTKRHRNRVLGQLLLDGLENTVTGRRHGYWASWVDKTDEPGRNDGHARYRYQTGQTPPHGRSYSLTDHGLLERAAEEGLRRGLGDALKPVWGMDGGRTKGGLSVAWTTRGGGEGKLLRHKVIFRPDGWRPGSGLDRLFEMLGGGGTSARGGADYEKEAFDRGGRRERQISRRGKRQAIGWIKDQQKRWKHLRGGARSSRPAAVHREAAVVRGLLQIGGRDYDGRPTPRATDANPPNLMLATLLGRGKLVFDRGSRGQGRTVYWAAKGQARRRIGTLEGAHFTPEPALRQRVGRYIGETVLRRVMSVETVRKGYGYDADRRFTRFRHDTQAESKEKLVVAGETIPVKRVTRITEDTHHSGHILDTVGRLWPESLRGLVDGSARNAKVSWTSSRLTRPKRAGWDARGSDVEMVSLPAGYVARHSLTFDHKEGYGGGHRVLYSYEITRAE